MEKYEIADNISDLQYCYSYCKICKREFSVSLSPSKNMKGLNSLNFFWKEGDTGIRDIIKKIKKEVKYG